MVTPTRQTLDNLIGGEKRASEELNAFSGRKRNVGRRSIPHESARAGRHVAPRIGAAVSNRLLTQVAAQHFCCLEIVGAEELFDRTVEEQTTLRPECAPAVEREEAAAAVLRQAAIDVPDREAVGPNRVQPHERDSSWLFERAAAREQGDRHPAPSTAEPQREEPAPREFAWLDSNPAEKAQERGSRNDLPEWLRADAARRPADREREEERDRQRER